MVSGFLTRGVELCLILKLACLGFGECGVSYYVMLLTLTAFMTFLLSLPFRNLIIMFLGLFYSVFIMLRVY